VSRLCRPSAFPGGSRSPARPLLSRRLSAASRINLRELFSQKKSHSAAVPKKRRKERKTLSASESLCVMHSREFELVWKTP
jgi:hypothetical protein